MPSADLRPGDRLRHKNGMIVTLHCRKRPDDGRSNTPFFPGWWLIDHGGLADFIIDDPESDWRLIDGDQRCLEHDSAWDPESEMCRMALKLDRPDEPCRPAHTDGRDDA